MLIHLMTVYTNLFHTGLFHGLADVFHGAHTLFIGDANQDLVNGTYCQAAKPITRVAQAGVVGAVAVHNVGKVSEGREGALHGAADTIGKGLAGVISIDLMSTFIAHTIGAPDKCP